MNPLPPVNRVLYALSSLGSEALGQSRNLWLVAFYAPPDDVDRPTLLPGLLLAVLLGVSRFVGALDDILIGYWSDRTRSRLGRRLPFILAGTPLWVISAVMIFTPLDGGNVATALYLFLALEALSIFSTVSGGPYEALLPEIARGSADRVGLVALRVYAGVSGAAIGLVASGLLVDWVGFPAMAAAMATLALVGRYAGVLGVWHHAARDQPPARLPLREALRSTFSNRQFLRFLPSFVLFQVGLAMLIALVPYYVKAVLQADREGLWTSLLTAVAIGSMLIAVPAFAKIAARTSKRWAFSAAMLAAVATFPLLAFAGFLPVVPKVVQAIIAFGLAGAPLAGVYLFPATLTADIVDDDALRGGMRREATYYGTQNFVEKSATALSPVVLLLLLLAGKSAGDPLGVRLVGPVAALFVLGGFLCFRSYSLPDAQDPPTPQA